MGEWIDLWESAFRDEEASEYTICGAVCDTTVMYRGKKFYYPSRRIYFGDKTFEVHATAEDEEDYIIYFDLREGRSWKDELDDCDLGDWDNPCRVVQI